jgi:hypothetical protein
MLVPPAMPDNKEEDSSDMKITSNDELRRD